MADREQPAMRREDIDAAFDAAMDRPEQTRAQWLAQTYGDRPDVLRKVLELVSREQAGRALFDDLEIQRGVLLGALLGVGESDDPDPRIGRDYGPWRVVAHIGSGGLAEVYEVQRADGRYEQRAAIKILRSGILGHHARALFLRERRLLANLDHPGIVRIIDGGETITGSPWLVMELAEGVPIDRYFAENKLDLTARLAMLAKVADIMSVAHASLVVHGDLKADHVLINDRGDLRLLDFGIAQALDEQGIGGATEGFSPDYASPEQVEGKSLTVASDIYQLGKIASQVTTGMPGDRALGAVIAKATSTTPQDRYPSMAGLVADLRAIVADRPVSALPDSRWQALRRTVRHNRLAAILAVAALAGSIGWATTATLSSARIARERGVAIAAADRERRGKEVLLELFRRADLLEADSLGLEPVAAAEMLDETLASARKSLVDDPAMLADLLNWTARAHLRAGQPEQARKLAEEELALLAGSDLRASLREGAARAFFAHILVGAGEAEMADHNADAALKILDANDRADPLALDLLVSAAWSKEGDWLAQERLFRRALAQAESLGNPKAEIEIRDGLARSLAGAGKTDEARSHVERSLELVRRYYGEKHPRMALPLSDLGRIEERAGNPVASATAHRKALEISVAAFGEGHASTLAHRNNLAIALMAAGEAEAAIGEYRRLVAILPKGLRRGEVAQNLGVALVQVGDFSGAEQALAIAEAASRANLPANHPRRAFPALTRSEMRIAQHRWSDAETDARFALAHLEKTLPAGHYATETARCRIGIALLGAGKEAQAADYIRPAIKALEKAGASVPERNVVPCRNAANRL